VGLALVVDEGGLKGVLAAEGGDLLVIGVDVADDLVERVGGTGIGLTGGERLGAAGEERDGAGDGGEQFAEVGVHEVGVRGDTPGFRVLR